QEITVSREIEYRFADDIRGELRRPLAVVPAATIGLDSDLLIVSKKPQASKHRIVPTVSNNTPGELSGNATLDLPAGWTKTPSSIPFKLPRFGDKTAFSFEVTVPANTAVGAYKIGAVAEAGGQRYGQSMQTIAYPHIQTHRIFKKADVTAHVLDLEVASVKIGYIMGSGDKVPEAIRRLGLDVTMLGEKDLSTGDLSAYDIIVVGIRASQVRPDFVANNGRLLDFARNGGTLVVQYQQQEYIQNNMQPFPASMTGVTRGNQRIGNVRTTDENAKVNVLVPDHPIFNYPNKIGDSDWANWIQERNLYCFSTWDPAYTALLESTDEGDDPNKGGMLYAPLGKGHYLYTSYSWFRQLPAGTPGAYRIFANILSLPKARK
ncbi:MAG TPA: NEW3 domain-containing protein, partial [Pyrinomonadaceae bacterium]|nr:NEW3 domain-containing protein [Pyrinomonadaceae bacterium]